MLDFMHVDCGQSAVRATQTLGWRWAIGPVETGPSFAGLLQVPMQSNGAADAHIAHCGSFSGTTGFTDSSVLTQTSTAFVDQRQIFGELRLSRLSVVVDGVVQVLCCCQQCQGCVARLTLESFLAAFRVSKFVPRASQHCCTAHLAYR